MIHTEETAGRHRPLDLEARAYDDGNTFRYLIPEHPAQREIRITAELTQFHFAKDGTTYPLILRDYRTPYEDDYHELAISALHPEYLIGLPCSFKCPGVAWAGITEADLDNYAGMYLGAHDPRTLEARLAPRANEPGLAVSTETPARYTPGACS